MCVCMHYWQWSQTLPEGGKKAFELDLGPRETEVDVNVEAGLPAKIYFTAIFGFKSGCCGQNKNVQFTFSKLLGYGTIFKLGYSI